MRTIELDRSDLTADWLQSIRTTAAGSEDLKEQLLRRVKHFLDEEKQEKVYLKLGEEAVA